ncbi:MAG: phage tail protein [Chloroflexota bacterium]|mgnify:CR=1 FL=1|nr:phage tail protein [Chloroflexota bacterium]
MPLVTNETLTGDPIVSYNFSLDLGGKATGYFTEVTGLGSETEVTEHKITAQGDKEAVRKIPGRLKWGDITLKRGLTGSMDIWEWRKTVEDGKVDQARVNGSIMMYDNIGNLVAQWDFVSAWPSKLSGPSLNTDSSAVGIEEVTIVHEGISRVL